MADINKFYQLVIQACNDPFIGYSQSQRRTITLGVSYRTYCDCSSLESWALTLSGFFTNNPWFATSNEANYLTQAGFRQVPISGEWKPGDIVLKPGHTEVVYQGRVTMGAHTDGIAFADQVSINNKATNPSYYTSCWRYQNGASGGEPETNISIYVAAAIIGNWMRESTNNPGIWQGLTVGTGGYGLGQWSGSRRDDLINWLNSNGYSQDDGDGQIKFFIEENDWSETLSTPLHFSNLQEFLLSTSTDIDALTETFCNAWERAGISALEERKRYAHMAYDYLLVHGSDTGINWIKGNYYLNETQMLNNAIRIYQQLSLLIGGSVGGQGWSNTLRYGCYRELYRRRFIWR